MSQSMTEKARARRRNALRYIEQKAKAGIARSGRDITNIFELVVQDACMAQVIPFRHDRSIVVPMRASAGN